MHDHASRSTTVIHGRRGGGSLTLPRRRSGRVLLRCGASRCSAASPHDQSARGPLARLTGGGASPSFNGGSEDAAAASCRRTICPNPAASCGLPSPPLGRVGSTRLSAAPPRRSLAPPEKEGEAQRPSPRPRPANAPAAVLSSLPPAKVAFSRSPGRADSGGGVGLPQPVWGSAPDPLRSTSRLRRCRGLRPLKPLELFPRVSLVA